MGLNLNIRRIIFYNLSKYNGDKIVSVPASQVKQIAGRLARNSHISAAGSIAKPPTPWYKPPPSQHSDDTILTALSEAIKNSSTKSLETSLKNLLPTLKPNHIINLINHNPHLLPPKSIFSFFTWLSSHSLRTSYRHTMDTYCTMAHFLCTHKMIPPVRGLLNIVVSRKGKDSAFSVFGAFVKTKGSQRSNLDVIFGGLINVYLDLGFNDDAIKCYELIKEHRYHLPFQGCLRILDYFMKCKSSIVVWNFYKELLKLGFPADLFCFNRMMHKLCKDGELKEAQMVFDEISKRGFKPSCVSFNTLINGYSRFGDLGEGFRLKRIMEETEVLPDVFTYSVLINGLCVVGELDSAVELFDEMTNKGLVPNDVTFTTLINGHCKSGKIGSAIEIYRKMLRIGIQPDLITYNTLVDGLCKGFDLRQARSLVAEMKERGLSPDMVTFTSLIDGYCKDGDLETALQIRNEMVREEIQLDSVAYTALISGLCKQGRVLDADKYLKEMSSLSLKPDCGTYTMVIDGFCKKGDVKKGFKLLEKMKRDGQAPNVITYNVLMNGLCKLGQMKNAEMLLHAMLNLGILPDDITFNILLEGHCNYANPEDVDKLRNEKGLVLDYGSYTSLIASLSKNSKFQNRK